MTPSGKCFLRLSTDAPEVAKVTPHAAAGLGHVSQVILVLKAQRGHGEQLRLCSGEATGAGAASAALEGPGLKGSWRGLRL